MKITAIAPNEPKVVKWFFRGQTNQSHLHPAVFEHPMPPTLEPLPNEQPTIDGVPANVDAVLTLDGRRVEYSPLGVWSLMAGGGRVLTWAEWIGELL